MVVVFVHPYHGGRFLSTFQTALRRTGGVLSAQQIEFPDWDDSVDGHCSVIIAVHNTTDSTVDPISLKTPHKFNHCQLGVSFGPPSMQPHQLFLLDGRIRLLAHQLLMASVPALT